MLRVYFGKLIYNKGKPQGIDAVIAEWHNKFPSLVPVKYSTKINLYKICEKREKINYKSNRFKSNGIPEVT